MPIFHGEHDELPRFYVGSFSDFSIFSADGIVGDPYRNELIGCLFGFQSIGSKHRFEYLAKAFFAFDRE